MRAWWVIPLLLLAGLTPPSAQAHVVVVPGAGDSAENATDLFAVPGRLYAKLPPHGGMVYHKVALAEGQEVRVRLVSPPGEFGDARPGLVLAGPGLESRNFTPNAVRLPDGLGVWSRLDSDPPASVVEALLPQRLDIHDDFILRANGTGEHFFVLYAPETGGAYALLVEPAGGRSARDWLDVPVQRLEARAWAGHPAWLLALPHVAALVALALAVRWQKRRGRVAGLFGVLALGVAGFLAASGLSLLVAAAPLLPDAWPAFLGGAWALLLAGCAFWLGFPPDPPAWKRFAMVAIGVVAFATWSGFLLGPLVALVAALMPGHVPARPG